VPLLTRALRIANDLLDKDPSGQNQTEPGSGTKAEERKIGFVVGPLREFTHPSLHLPTSSCVEISVDWSHQLSEPVLSCVPLGDPRHPYAHIHLHAIKGSWDLASYYRKAMVYNFVGWYELEDLIAEIR
jgi:hypothetical protein